VRAAHLRRRGPRPVQRLRDLVGRPHGRRPVQHVLPVGHHLLLTPVDDMDDDGAQQPTTRQRSRGSRGPGGVLAAAVALVLVFLAVRLTSSSSPEPDHDRPEPTPGRTHPTEFFDMATRGTLADDAAWVAGIASSPAVAGLPAERHVTLATDVPEERIAFVLGRDADHVVAAW